MDKTRRMSLRCQICQEAASLHMLAYLLRPGHRLSKTTSVSSACVRTLPAAWKYMSDKNIQSNTRSASHSKRPSWPTVKLLHNICAWADAFQIKYWKPPWNRPPKDRNLGKEEVSSPGSPVNRLVFRGLNRWNRVPGTQQERSSLVQLLFFLHDHLHHAQSWAAQSWKTKNPNSQNRIST